MPQPRIPAHTFALRVRPGVIAALAMIGAGALAVSASAAIRSNLTIPEGETFELGGGQQGSFTVTGRNTGPVAVEVLGKAEGAAAGVMRATVAPGASLEAAFASGEVALLRNTSASEAAQLKLRITGDTSALGMGYAANR
jgi:hypothetical protein